MSARRTLTVLLAATVALGLATPATRADITDDDVTRAIAKAKEYLMNRQDANGGWRDPDHSCMVYMTLAYVGLHPNKTTMESAMKYVLGLSRDDLGRPGYTLPMKVMGTSYLYHSGDLAAEKRKKLRAIARQDIIEIIDGQTQSGGWRYRLQGQSWDFSVSQWPVMALKEAYRMGIEEVTREVLLKALKLYVSKQHADGGFDYGARDTQSYGSMSAAGTASLIILRDLLDPNSGCPCAGGRSRRPKLVVHRNIDAGINWLSQNFDPDSNPNSNGTPGNGRTLYWLYTAERVGVNTGYKYFGEYDWYRLGAEYLVNRQKGDGSWGDLHKTCFALIYLYKGRGPILFNKLKFDGKWHQHRRDMANLVRYIGYQKEQLFHWQIVSLRGDNLDELHEAPILYITAESVPQFTDADKQLLRRYTDTGGTILFEASCGNPEVREWFRDFAKDVWPEWRLGPLGSDHLTFKQPYPLDPRPEVLGLDDGIRTFLIYAPDDVSCAWQSKMVTRREYLFRWGINLVTYATEHRELRAKLAAHRPDTDEPERYTKVPVRGPGGGLEVVRVKHGGDWDTGERYRPFASLSKYVSDQAGFRIDYDGSGTAPSDLKPNQVAFITGSDEAAFDSAAVEALKAFAAKGGKVWFEAATGSREFHQSMAPLVAKLGWRVRPFLRSDPVVDGDMDGATGYDLSSGVRLRYALKTTGGHSYAVVWGLYDGEKLVGVYSPYDTVFSTTPYAAGGCRGYKTPDARAVATNIALLLATTK